MAAAATASSSLSVRHLVVPGQIIAVSSDADGSGGGFLRGHGTYVETIPPDDGAVTPRSGGIVTMEDEPAPKDSGDGDDGDDDAEMAESGGTNSSNRRLMASVAGTIERVNKLISVIPTSSTLYSGQVGDLIIGRISAVGGNRWKVSLTPATRTSGASRSVCRDGQLPLSGVDLPGGVQRIRTAEDARGMRTLYGEGDLLSAEVQNVQQSDGTLVLHTRSLRYGKLENGVLAQVPPGLVRRMRQHMCTLDDIGVDVLIGCNGGIWIQRAMPKVGGGGGDAGGGGGAAAAAPVARKVGAEHEEDAAPLAETLQKLRVRHAATPVLPDERETIARVRNCVECLRLVHCFVTPENIRKIYEESIGKGGAGGAVGGRIGGGVKVGDMLRPENVVRLTACTRSS